MSIQQPMRVTLVVAQLAGSAFGQTGNSGLPSPDLISNADHFRI
jgi:hypothetical protein